MNMGNFNAYPSVQLGLMYTNEQKTFSISGSVSVSRYNNYAPFYAPSNTAFSK